MIPLISADLFGLENLGANYKTATLGEAVGFLLVGKVRPLSKVPFKERKMC